MSDSTQPTINGDEGKASMVKVSLYTIMGLSGSKVTEV